MKQLFKDAEDGNTSGLPDEELEDAINNFSQPHYNDNYTFRIIDFEDLPEVSETRDQFLNEFGNQFVPVSVTNNKDTVSQEVLEGEGESLKEEDKVLQKIRADVLVLVGDHNGEYRVKAVLPGVFADKGFAELMYQHDLDILNKINKAIGKKQK